MPTVLEVLINFTREAAESLENSAKAMPEDKLTWSPLDAGRTALNQLFEIGHTSRFTARMLRERAVPEFNMEEYGKQVAEVDSLEKALAFLHSGVEDFIAAVREFPEADLGETLVLEFLGGAVKSYLDIIYYPYWNMTYHLGQINYIQILYGDKQMH